jgi:hypothetical protein
MIEVYTKLITINRRLTTNDLDYENLRYNSNQLYKSRASEDFILLSKHHSIPNLRKFHSSNFEESKESSVAAVISLSLHKRTEMKLRKYSCNDVFKSTIAVDEDIDSSNSIEKKNFLISKIIEERKQASRRILNFFRKVVLETKEQRRNELINLILETRSSAALSIQKVFRGYRVRHSLRELLTVKTNDYIFLYKNEDQSVRPRIQLSLHDSKGESLLNLTYSAILDTYYICLKNIKVMRKKILVNFIVNEKVIIDHRYKVDCQGGKFYNILDSTMLRRRRHHKSQKVHHKGWEKVFEINNEREPSNISSDISVSEQPDIDKFLKKITNCAAIKKIKKQVRPILKKLDSIDITSPNTTASSFTTITSSKNVIKKKVSFSPKDFIYQYN